MEQVFPVEIKASSAGIGLTSRPGVKQAIAGKQGVVEKILEPGSFIVTLADGGKVKVQGPLGLKIGSRVQVSRASGKGQDLSAGGSVKNAEETETGLQGSVLMSLGFGGRNAKARLEIYVDKQPSGDWKKVSKAIYFVLTVQTQELGEVQWSIHMQGRNIALQVFAPQRNAKPNQFQSMVREIERALKAQGFVLTVPTLYLSQAFKAPSGYRLNVRG